MQVDPGRRQNLWTENWEQEMRSSRTETGGDVCEQTERDDLEETIMEVREKKPGSSCALQTESGSDQNTMLERQFGSGPRKH